MAPDATGSSSTLLNRKTAVVTGAGDIGAVVVRELLRHGATVEAWDRSETALEGVGRLGHRDVTTESVDITSEKALESATARAADRMGGIDILVNTAAVLTFGTVSEMVPAVWRETVEVNLTGVFLCCRAVVGHMVDRGRGSIVNISSIAGLRGTPDLSHYSATKFGVIGFTQALAREVGPMGVRANCVCPGAIVSSMNRETLSSSARRLGASVDAAERQVVDRTPLRRQGDPEDVANAVVFLASDLSSFITGETIAVTGGLN